MTMLSKTNPAWLAVAGIVMLGGALLFQHVGGLQPCVLCIYQRWPWGIAIGLGVIALVFVKQPKARGAIALLGSLTLLVGAGIGAFHVGVEQGWWQGTPGCGATLSSGGSIEDITAQLLATPVVRCDEIAWSLAGISMAGYNALVSLVLAVVALISARHLLKRAVTA
jgi:disulfide bond formation protein DsbB